MSVRTSLRSARLMAFPMSNVRVGIQTPRERGLGAWAKCDAAPSYYCDLSIRMYIPPRIHIQHVSLSSQ
jgi:hypothetical protein